MWAPIFLSEGQDDCREPCDLVNPVAEWRNLFVEAMNAPECSDNTKHSSSSPNRALGYGGFDSLVLARHDSRSGSEFRTTES